MNIAVVYQGKFPPEKGASGSDRRVRDITRGISQNNIVYMLVPFWNKSTKENQDAGDFEIQYLGSKKFSSIHSRLSFWSDIKSFVKRKEINSIIFYNTTFDGIPTAQALKRRGVTVAYEICDLPSSNVTGYKKQLIRLGERYMPKSTNLNITISEFLGRKVKEAAPSTPSIRIPILVDTDTFYNDEKKAASFRKRHHISDSEIIIAYAGGTWKQEGLKYLVQAFELLSKELKNIRLVIAGRLVKSPEHDDVEGLISLSNLNRQIIALGWVSTDDIVELYSAADILALPQIYNVFNIAGLPTKLAEYASMGKAIVATDVGDVNNYFQDGLNIALCNPEDPYSLKETLVEVIKDKALRLKLANGAKIIANSKFDYKVCGRAIVSKLETLSR